MTADSVARLPGRKLCLSALLLAISLAPGHLATPDAHLRLAQARNLVTNGSLGVPEGVGNTDHGNLVPRDDGDLHSVYNPGHSLLLAPIYALATAVPTPSNVHAHYVAAFGASVVGVLAQLLVGGIFLALLLNLDRGYRRSIIVAAVFTFGSFSLPSAGDGYDHVFEALTLVLAVYLLLSNAKAGKHSQPALAGLALGAGVLFRYSALLALPGLLWLVRDRRSRIRILLGLSPAIILALLYNFYRFGSFLETGYPTAWQLAHGTDIDPTGFGLANIPINFLGLLASPGKGLIWFCPVVALSIPAWRRFRKVKPRIADSLLIIVTAYILFYAANFAWHGSVWSWGPRYLEAIVPLLVVSTAFLPKRRIWRHLFLVVGIASIAIQAAAMIADHRRHLLQEMREAPSGFEERILYRLPSSPVLGQFRSAAHTLQATISGGQFEAFIAPGPWQSVARPASNEMMLQQSIDMNVVDVWWIRLAHLTRSNPITFVLLSIGVSGLVATAWLVRSVCQTVPAV